MTATRRLKEVVGKVSEVDVLAPESNVYVWRKALEIVFTKADNNFTLCTRKNLDRRGEVGDRPQNDVKMAQERKLPEAL